MNFDEKTIQHLRYYVYVLIDPINGKPFYVGKGKGPRIFNHVNCALDNPSDSDKYELIRQIQASGNCVSHVIIRHGLSEEEAFKIESSLIDFSVFFGHELTNKVLGHNSIDNGVMTTDEIIRKYNAPKLEKLRNDAIIININKTYKRGSGIDGIYKATKESWVISQDKREQIKFALSEYRGLIVEVFKINEWYPVETIDKKENKKIRWGFNGAVASRDVRDLYINTSVAHVKSKGAANPVRYTIETHNNSMVPIADVSAH